MLSTIAVYYLLGACFGMNVEHFTYSMAKKLAPCTSGVKVPKCKYWPFTPCGLEKITEIIGKTEIIIS